LNTCLYIQQKDKTTVRKSITVTNNDNSDALFDRKIDIITAGLESTIINHLNMLPKENTFIIIKYILAMRMEINLSDNYRRLNINTLYYLSNFFDNRKSFKQITREDLFQYLDSFRKSESSDSLHKWIGTYNLYRILLIRFLDGYIIQILNKRNAQNQALLKIFSPLKRKEQSIYKPTDLWNKKDDIIFLKYCPSSRDRCYHTMARDSSCRPHEILNIRLRDIVLSLKLMVIINMQRFF
jgi:hypothetical protein